MTEPADFDGIVLQLRDAKVQTAMALLAVRRGELIPAAVHLVNAQRALAAAEIDASTQRGRE